MKERCQDGKREGHKIEVMREVNIGEWQKGKREERSDGKMEN